MNVVYASNDAYVRHLGTSMCSLFDRNRSCQSITVYILSLGLSEDSRAKLEEIAGQYGRRLVFAEVGDLESRFDFPVDTGGYDLSIMSRLFMGELLPNSVKRVLYLDCDTIVCQSIRPLYETGLGDALVGMVMEPTVYREMKESIGLGRDDPYYNSGVLLMDLDRWRGEDVLKKLLDFYKSCHGRLFACDQDTINGALKGRIKTLPVKYNYFTNYRYFRYSTLCTMCAAYREIGEEAYLEARRSPAIIHYLGDERPWIAGNHNHFKKLYEYYLARTPWKDTPRQTGKERYMHMWWLFNRLTWLCPPFRLWVSRHMGMKLVDSRRKRK